MVGIFCLVFLFEAGFGLYYAQSEFSKKGWTSAIDPFARGLTYIFPPGREYRFDDSYAYNRLAYSLLEKGGFYNPLGQVSAWVTPGYPLALAVVYGAFGYSFLAALLLNALCVTLAYYFLFRLSREQFGPSVAWIVLGLLALNLRISYHVGYAYSDLLFVCLLSVTVYLAHRVLSEPNLGWRWFFWLGVIAGYGTLVRPVMAPVLAVLVVVSLMQRVPWPKLLLACALAALVFCPWVIRNYIRFGRFVISTASEQSWAFVDYEAYRNFSFWDSYRVIHPAKMVPQRVVQKAQQLGETGTLSMERTSYLLERTSYLFREDFQQWRRQNLGLYLWVCAWRFKSMLMPYTADMSVRNQHISLAVWCLTFPPAVAAGFWLWRNKFYWITWALVGALSVLPALLGVDMYLRYQLPGQLLLSVPAGFFFHSVYEQARRRAATEV
jgi:4-amino-4-deoxy-L-arabinose transferase-like glycosyltransferase